MSFVHLHAHSCYSLMRGVPFPEELVLAARRAGYDRLAVTDTDGLYGLLWFLEAARAHGLRPLVGVELTDPRAPGPAGPCGVMPGGAGTAGAAGDVGRARAVVLARDEAGYRALCRLVTARHMDPRFRLADALAGLSGREAYVLTDAEGLLVRLAGRPHVFAELLPGRPNWRLMRLAARLGLRTVATTGAHHLHPEQRELHRLLRAIAGNRTLADLDARFLAPPAWTLAGPDEVRRLFSFAPEAVAATVEIADGCRSDWSFTQVLWPAFEDRAPDDSFALLRRRCREGIGRRYGDADAGLSARIEARLAHELDVIRCKRFADMFLVVADIVGRTGLTCGRGSAAASLVGYLLGITHVDPIRHDLYFERFLSPDRRDPPDIDVDFAWDERDEVLDYVFRRYGRERTAMIANHVCFRGRAALREVAKVHGLPDGEIGSVTKRLRGLWGWHARDLSETIRTHPMFRGLRLDEPWPRIVRLAQLLEGRPRHLSVHCGGVVVAPRRLADHAPCQTAPKGVPIVQWEKDQAEEAGLVKIDLLGNRSLAVIRDALRDVNERHGLDLRYESLDPLRDPETRALLARGDTIGVFYVESPPMRQLQRKTGKGDFEHLVIHSSIIRPAANAYIDEYVERLAGKPWRPLHPRLGELLRETHGIMVYQEDVSRTAVALAGFAPAEAETLRKVLTKKSKRKLGEYRRRFYEGALRRGLDAATVDAVWDMIMSFAGYSFCKPHSASYALVSFKSAWLKAHHPAEFLAAVLSNQGGYYSAFAYVSEARRLGLRVLPPDVNASEDRWTGHDDWLRVGLMQIARLGRDCRDRLLAGRRRAGPFASFADFLRRVDPDPADVRTLVKAGCFDALEPGATRPELIWRLLVQEAAAGRAAAGRVAAGRAVAGGAAGRAAGGANYDLFAAAAGNGAGSIALPGSSRLDSPARTEGGRAGGGRAGAAPPSSRLDPAVGGAGARAGAGPAPRPPQYDEKTMLRHEVEALGFLASRHPLTLYEEELARIPHIEARDLLAHAGRRVRMVGWYVTGKVVTTKRSEPMEFVSFEDTTDIFETVFFPAAYARFCQVLSRSRPYLLEGRVEQSHGVATLNVRKVRLL